MQNDPEMLLLGFLSMIFIILTEKNLCDWISDILMEATWENMSYIQPLNLPTLMYPVSSISYKCLFYVKKIASYVILIVSQFIIKTSIHLEKKWKSKSLIGLKR